LKPAGSSRVERTRVPPYGLGSSRQPGKRKEAAKIEMRIAVLGR
jgi:hypothetical protein